MIALSMDIDWAPEWAIAEAVARVRAHDRALTLFVTHASDAVETASADPRVERGLHPNYMPGSSHGGSVTEVLDTVAAWAPEAVGVRSHGLWRGTSYVVEYGQRGLRYESSDLLFLQPGLRAGRYWNGVAQLPIWWEDDVHMLHGMDMHPDALPLDDAPPLAVMDLHPILIALNSADLDGYGALKAFLSEHGRGLTTATRDEVERFANRSRAGVADVLDHVCAWCAARGEAAHTLAEVAAMAEAP